MDWKNEFVHLHTHTPFSFLDGASSIDDLIKKAVQFEMPALGITDHNNVCAAVKFFQRASQAGIKPIQGTEISLENGSHLTLIARSPQGYASICSLLTRAHLDNPRGEEKTAFNHLQELTDVFILSGCRHSEIATLILESKFQQAYDLVKQYLSLFGRDNFYIEIQDNRLPGNSRLNHYLLQIAADLGAELVATNNVHYAEHQDFIIHDLLTCIRIPAKVQDITPLRPFNGENYLKSSAQMAELFSFCPQALENCLRISQQCTPAFSTPQPLHFPHFQPVNSSDSAQLLHYLTFEGAVKRYGQIKPAIRKRLEYELNIINKMGFADYFLLVWDLVRFSRSKGIRYAGRGSAADSLTAFCLFITEVDSLERGLLFERFMSPERSHLPDIDIDFESRYRDKVIDYIYRKYGHERVARVATYNTFKARSALRDLGKALGFDEQELDQVAKRLPHTYADNIRNLAERLPELRNSPLQEERFQTLLDACEKIAGFPRFLGTHLGGVVISDCPLTKLTPLQRSAIGPVITQFDKDDIEGLGLVKLDLLSLRTMSVISEASSTIKQTDSDFDYDCIPLDDQATYEMIARAETVGVFQLESSAQRALQAQLGTSRLEDVVASIALIRPGPIKGNMVQPYIARRHGEEPITYLHPLLQPILGKTYGVVLFQEQVMEIATSIAGFTPGEADQLRRVMTHARSQSTMNAIGDNFVNKAVARGIKPETAREIFKCIAGYANYGFCEAHAAAFATTSFKTAYLLQHYPSHYYAAILNHQPMGYYPANVICTQARNRGIKLLPPDVNSSDINFTVEPLHSIRVGLRQVKGISREEIDSVIAAREKGKFISLSDLVSRTSLKPNTLENLIKCGALESLYPNRRELLSLLPHLIKTRNHRQNPQGLLITQDADYIPELIDFSPSEKRFWEYKILGIDIYYHFMASLRQELQKRNIKSSRELKDQKNNSMVSVCGLLLNPHRPPTRSGQITVFLSLEDEFGLIDVTVFEKVYHKFGQIIFGEQYAPLLIRGKLQKRGQGSNIIANHITFLKLP